MKLLKLTACYPDYLNYFYSRHSNLSLLNYQEQKSLFDRDAFSWADFWKTALENLNLGYEVQEITLNFESAQRAWAQKHLPAEKAQQLNLHQIALEQIKAFKPNILWFDHHDASFLKQIRESVPSIRLVLGWVGSAFPPIKSFIGCDLVLSCAPESVMKLRHAGFRSEHLNHGFDPRINERLRPGTQCMDLSFIGQIIQQSEFHTQRIQMLDYLANNTAISIFAPLPPPVTRRSYMSFFLRMGLYLATIPLRVIPGTGYQRSFPSFPKKWAASPKLLQQRKSAVFGLEMYQVLKDSKITLNIHADSSPTHASNMRLFETTGVGTCLLTDWKDNLAGLFTPDKEVVTYRTAEECLEKIRWLLDHPHEREKIAAAGRARTLQQHTYTQRAAQLHTILSREIKKL